MKGRESDKDAERRLVGHLTDTVHAICVIAKLSPPDNFQESLAAIAQLTRKFERAVGQGITSCEYVLNMPDPGDVFVESKMEDAGYSEPSKISDGKVVCVTEMGLSRLVKGVTVANDEIDEQTVLVKTKVMLDVTWGIPILQTKKVVELTTANT